MEGVDCWGGIVVGNEGDGWGVKWVNNEIGVIVKVEGRGGRGYGMGWVGVDRGL